MVIVCSLEVVKFEFHAAEKRGAWHADKAPLVQRLFQVERRDLGRFRHEPECLRGQQRGAKDSAVAWHDSVFAALNNVFLTPSSAVISFSLKYLGTCGTVTCPVTRCVTARI